MALAALCPLSVAIGPCAVHAAAAAVPPQLPCSHAVFANFNRHGIRVAPPVVTVVGINIDIDCRRERAAKLHCAGAVAAAAAATAWPGASTRVGL